MTTEIQHLLDVALGLPDADRAELAGLLIESLHQGVEENVQEQWSEEIGRRLAELDRGEVKTIPWSEVRRRMSGKQDASPRS